MFEKATLDDTRNPWHPNGPGDPVLVTDLDASVAPLGKGAFVIIRLGSLDSPNAQYVYGMVKDAVFLSGLNASGWHYDLITQDGLQLIQVPTQRVTRRRSYQIAEPEPLKSKENEDLPGPLYGLNQYVIARIADETYVSATVDDREFHRGNFLYKVITQHGVPVSLYEDRLLAHPPLEARFGLIPPASTHENNFERTFSTKSGNGPVPNSVN
jgi:hypothetical protein